MIIKHSLMPKLPLHLNGISIIFGLLFSLYNGNHLDSILWFLTCFWFVLYILEEKKVDQLIQYMRKLNE